MGVDVASHAGDARGLGHDRINDFQGNLLRGRVGRLPSGCAVSGKCH
jgi:hypothetical protein